MAYYSGVAWDPFSRRSTKADPAVVHDDPNPNPDH